MNIKHLHEAPNLTTALTGPLLMLETHLLERQSIIETWFRKQWLDNKPPFYASVDIRNAGFKVAPVDTNLFPAGFNNINEDFAPLCIQAIQSALDKACPDAIRILILPENHTRNKAYLESIATLHDLLVQSGYFAEVGTLNPEIEKPTQLELESGKSLQLLPVHRKDNRLLAGDFDPCVVLLNNDLSDGVPDILQGLSQVITPPPDLGWSKRLKSDHFEFYRTLAVEFSEIIDMDPWFFDPLFMNCQEINFMEKQGGECLAEKTDKLLLDIQKKYDEHEITSTPYVVIKADAGTYGMGVMIARSADDVIDLNRKQRTKMSKSKGGQQIEKVILQEGVPTYETWGDSGAVTEPVVYMMDRYVVGGFYRVHTNKGAEENLNSPGMHFQPLAFEEPCNVPDSSIDPDAAANRFYTYGVIARLALLAAAREIKSISGDHA